MSTPKIQTALDNANRDIGVVEKYWRKSQAQKTLFQGIIAEILFLRLFGILEKTVCDISCRVACGCNYTNGIVATPSVTARSLSDALSLFENYNRKKKRIRAKFTNVSFTNDTIKEVIPFSEPFCSNLHNYINEFDEMRVVRNHIAHRTSDTRSKYKTAIIKRYGYAPKITPSVFLISTTREPIPLLEQYITTVRLMLTDLARGY